MDEETIIQELKAHFKDYHDLILTKDEIIRFCLNRVYDELIKVKSKS
jgi:hypothetical protein